ncbi:Col [Candidatus Terasakiella magnetica]|uniref:Col n=1 Tax=Candidatus Terasakiella magnetica TaxID=1867952 RepID=A0A1C3REC3_9PROT|nr:U32 family peptidase [Candidatus Terasakiella magnetica]SCA55637.1 Col [Candidatus Terasakiella magnetica]
MNMPSLPHVSRPKRSELLMPAGSLTKLKTAILYGADAVYAGTPDLSLRTQSSFTLEELIEGVKFVHEHGKRIYLTLNLFTHNSDIEKLPKFIETIRTVKPDGVIIADPGVFQFVRQHAPELEAHVSTQANVCSWLTVDFWRNQGASLVVLARETSFEELAEIREKQPEIKLEAFVQGSMCMTYSGRCLLSNFMSERGANQGNCAHSCRWKYKLNLKLKDGTDKAIEITDQNADLFEFLMEEQFRPGELFPIEEDNFGSYILNSKDLCLMPVLPEYLKLGVDSLKVEGRNKSEYYAAITARAYRLAIDDWYKDPENWDPEPYLRELYTLQNRGFTMGFHEGRLTGVAHNYDRTKPVGGWQYGGLITKWDGDDMIFEIRNFLLPGDVIEFLPPKEIEPIRLRLYEFEDAKTGEITHKVNPGQGKAIRVPISVFDQENPEELKKRIPALTVARRETPMSEEERVSRLSEIRAQELERGLISEEEYRAIMDDPELLGKRISMKANTGHRAPKQGLDSCCGKGCNGCLMFWQDDKYAKAREKMKEKKIGEMLEVTEVS